MRIAVCDDEKGEIEKLEKIIFSIQGNYQVDTYQSGGALLESVRQGSEYALLFCDIYLGDENGLDVAKEMQRLSPGTAVVFITTSTEHAVEAFSVRALHYLVKPVSEQDIAEALDRLGKKQSPRHTLTLRIDRNITVLYQDQIIRVEGQDHRTVITCQDNTAFSIWKSYGEISALLDDSFLHIKKGVSVNMRHVDKMTAQKCVMKDGSAFLLRRDMAKENRERYFAFLEKELRNA
ncbi:MAG: response regulator transcription factor [Oscillospiraceae bacterium]|nr:response regulator transcription factor [Oscillospiraceae bacterium]